MIQTFRHRFRSSFLKAISPLDGRYARQVEPLAPYFSEAALMKYRILVESQWLLHMLHNKIIPSQHSSLSLVESQLETLLSNFDFPSAQKVKNIESVTNHDLKSVEYFIKENIEHHRESIHFCCTS
jgi:adenylosuccinate lyase